MRCFSSSICCRTEEEAVPDFPLLDVPLIIAPMAMIMKNIIIGKSRSMLTPYFLGGCAGLGASAPGAAALAMPVRISVSAMVFCML